MGEKYALIIGNSNYEHLPSIPSVENDAKELVEVLSASDIGNFDSVEHLINLGFCDMRKAIVKFLSGRHKTDVCILYFSGHGLRHYRHRRFYLAATDTDNSDDGRWLEVRGISAEWLRFQFSKSLAKSLVLILDCCFSGLFPGGIKTVDNTPALVKGELESTSGSGRVVITSSNATQYSWEGKKLNKRIKESVFTHFLVEGLRTGNADKTNDGQISIQEIYDYVFTKVTRATDQEPQIWIYKGSGNSIVIAKNQTLEAQDFGILEEDKANIPKQLLECCSVLLTQFSTSRRSMPREQLVKIGRGVECENFDSSLSWLVSNRYFNEMLGEVILTNDKGIRAIRQIEQGVIDNVVSVR